MSEDRFISSEIIHGFVYIQKHIQNLKETKIKGGLKNLLLASRVAFNQKVPPKFPIPWVVKLLPSISQEKQACYPKF